MLTHECQGNEDDPSLMGTLGTHTLEVDNSGTI